MVDFLILISLVLQFTADDIDIRMSFTTNGVQFDMQRLDTISNTMWTNFCSRWLTEQCCVYRSFYIRYKDFGAC